MRDAFYKICTLFNLIWQQKYKFCTLNNIWGILSLLFFTFSRYMKVCFNLLLFCFWKEFCYIKLLFLIIRFLNDFYPIFYVLLYIFLFIFCLILTIYRNRSSLNEHTKIKPDVLLWVTQRIFIEMICLCIIFRLKM